MNKYKNFSIFKEIDLFGKEPDIYYKGKQRKTTWMGRICTWLYIIIYIFFFVYKLVRMFKRLDVKFSETNSSTGGLPKIHMTKELFTYAIALADPYQNPFIDETIYHPEGVIVSTRTINGKPKTVYKPIDFGICNINDFGKGHQQYAQRLNLSNYYCFKNLDVDFEGYNSAENTTNIMFTINICNQTKKTTGEPCKNRAEILARLNYQNLLMISEDYDITPYDYEKPIKAKLNINTCPIRLDQYQRFAGYYQLTSIETDRNIFGFEALSDIKTEKYLIYDSAIIMSSKMEEYQEDVIQYIILMSEKIKTIQRTYTQLIDVLGDVGGLMEVMESVLGVICLLVADILYDKTMVNNLFSFNVEDYMIKIKTKLKESDSINKSKNEENNNEDNFDKKTIDISKKTLNKEAKDNSIYLKKDSFKPKTNDKKKSLNENLTNTNIIINSSGRKSFFKRNTIKIQKSVLFPQSKIVKENNKEQELNINNIEIYENKKDIVNKQIYQNKFIKKLNTNILCTYFCFCCSRKRENFANVLLDEAMSVITEKLDIYNIFRNMYYVDDVKKKTNYEFEDFEITEECKEKLKKISHKIYNSFYDL